jgi:2-keto-4-pentenoate hydratase/2-oxohepta-3-ene-1,7-dioic acid hydratase in catechol pathway
MRADSRARTPCRVSEPFGCLGSHLAQPSLALPPGPLLRRPFAHPAASALDFTQLHLETRLNGRVVQSQPTNELIFSIPELIETLSMGTTLQPGDVIATGTPEGVAAASGVFLKTGDRVDITITGLGTLSNVVGDGSVPLAPAEPVLRHHV